MILTGLRHLIIGAGLILLWQSLIVFFELPDYILPSPSHVFLTLYRERSVIMIQSVATLTAMLSGFLLGILFGCVTAIAITYSRLLKLWLLPLLIISQAIPLFAIAPLLVIWLGYGIASKIAATLLMVFFPIASSFYDALQRLPPAWQDLAHTMQAGRWRFFWYIRIPAALPGLCAGIRIAAVLTPIAAILGEWVGSGRGLGYLMLNANARMQIDMMFAVLTVIIMLALALYFGVDNFLRKAVWWK